MQFDVIIGNPPYQMNDKGGNGSSAMPIYHLFIKKAKQLDPRYLTMVIPARWYAGGKGLDEFRRTMLSDKRIRKLVDFENSAEVFPCVIVAGGICYFLWDRDHCGLCEVVNTQKDGFYVTVRKLDEFQTFVRHSRSVPIIRKILTSEQHRQTLDTVVSPRRPFGLSSTYTPSESGVPCWFTQKIGLRFAKIDDVSDFYNYLNKWKFLIPFAPIAGQTDFSKPVGFYHTGNTRIAKPGECCTESWLVACAYETEEEVIAFRSYLFTKIVRFLLLQTVVSQNVTRERFIFVPHLGEYHGLYTDELLRKRWAITDEEWAFIDSKIKLVE